MSKRHTAILLVGLALLAAALRLWRLDELPPGLWWDEGHHNWAALNILQGAPRPVYFTEAFGFEPLHIYLTALWFRLFGVHDLAPRLVSALAGTLTVPALYWAAIEWLRDPLGESRARTIGLLAAATLATLFIHVLQSRIGFEVVLTPALTAPTVAALGRGLRTRRTGWFMLAGLLQGLTLYTYPSSRVTPLIIALWVALLLAIDRATLRATWRQLALLVAVAVATYAPLGWFFVRNPAWFLGRASYVSSGARSGWLPLLTGIWRTALGLFVRGELYPRHNLPGRPLLDPLLAAPFLLGLGVVAWTARRRDARALWFLPVWLAVVLIPSALADGAPSFTRGLGAVLPVALLVGVGGEWLWQRARSRWGRRLPTALLALVWLVSSTLSVHDYFVRYAARAELFDAFQVGLWEALEEARAASETGHAYLSPVSATPFEPTVDFVLRTRPAIRAYNGRVCLILPRQTEQETTYVLLTLDDRDSLLRLQGIFPTGAVVRQILHEPEPYVYAEVLRVPASSVAQIDATPVDVRFGDAIALIGYEATVADDTLNLTLYWESLAPVTVDYTVFVHLDASGQTVAQSDGWPCASTEPTTRWRRGEVVVERRQVALPVGADDGDLYVGLYNLATLERIPITAASVPQADDRALIITLP